MLRIERGAWSFDDFPDAWRCVSPLAKDLIRALLQPDPSKRLGADAVLQSRWVAVRHRPSNHRRPCLATASAALKVVRLDVWWSRLKGRATWSRCPDPASS